MKNKYFTLILIIFSCNAFSEWESIGLSVSNGVEIFYDRDSILTKGNSVRVWIKANTSKESYKSSRTFVEYNCKEKEVELLEMTTFDDFDLKGAMKSYKYDDNDPNKKHYIAPNSFDEEIHRRICE